MSVDNANDKTVSDEDYKPWVSIDDDGSVLVELRISPTKRFSIEVNPDGTHESCYVEDGKVRSVTGPPASDDTLRYRDILKECYDAIGETGYWEELPARIKRKLERPTASDAALPFPENLSAADITELPDAVGDYIHALEAAQQPASDMLGECMMVPCNEPGYVEIPLCRKHGGEEENFVLDASDVALREAATELLDALGLLRDLVEAVTTQFYDNYKPLTNIGVEVTKTLVAARKLLDREIASEGQGA